MNFFDNYDLAEPWWLLLLLGVPLLMLLGYRQGTRSWLVYPTLRVLGTLGLKPKDRPFHFAPLILPLMLIPAIFGLARPQETRSRTSSTASGIDIIIALDVSYSMSTTDFYESDNGMRRPQRRINAAKKIITEFIERRPDDRIGIVSFAARPYTVAPITLDHQILEFTLRDVALVSDRTEGGTAIGSAIVAAGDRLETLTRDSGKKGSQEQKQSDRTGDRWRQQLRATFADRGSRPGSGS
ncbi:VWA domain-containing protein [bacterium]|nr:VWA domain-containing protein [bacterium]